MNRRDFLGIVNELRFRYQHENQILSEYFEHILSKRPSLPEHLTNAHAAVSNFYLSYYPQRDYYSLDYKDIYKQYFKQVRQFLNHEQFFRFCMFLSLYRLFIRLYVDLLNING